MSGPVAQRIKRLTTSQEIPGSNPGRLEICILLHKALFWCQIFAIQFWIELHTLTNPKITFLAVGLCVRMSLLSAQEENKL